MKTKWPSYAAFDPEYSHDDGDLPLWMISLRTSANAMNHCSRSVNRSGYGFPFFLVSVWTALSSGDHTSRFESSGVVCGIASKSCLRKRAVQRLLLVPLSASNAVFRNTTRSSYVTVSVFLHAFANQPIAILRRSAVASVSGV